MNEREKLDLYGQEDCIRTAIAAYLQDVSPSPTVVKAFKDEYHKGSGDAALAIGKMLKQLAAELERDAS